MKTLIALFLAASFAGAAPQVPDMKPPAELKQLGFLVGDFEGQNKFFEPDGSSKSSPATIKASMAVGGRFLSWGYKGNMPGFGDVEGLLLMTYDADSKKFLGWWYDNAGSRPMEMSGGFEGVKLVMTSLPSNAPGMEGAVFRSTFSKKSATEVAFLLESKMGDQWMTFIDGSYKKR